MRIKPKQVSDCELSPCLVGRPVVEETISRIRSSFAKNNIAYDDKEFLGRYAESVTNFGSNINTNVTEGGFGIWRLTENEAREILQNTKKRVKRENLDFLSSDFQVSYFFFDF